MHRINEGNSIQALLHGEFAPLNTAASPLGIAEMTVSLDTPQEPQEQRTADPVILSLVRSHRKFLANQLHVHVQGHIEAEQQLLKKIANGDRLYPSFASGSHQYFVLEQISTIAAIDMILDLFDDENPQGKRNTPSLSPPANPSKPPKKERKKKNKEEKPTDPLPEEGRSISKPTYPQKLYEHIYKVTGDGSGVIISSDSDGIVVRVPDRSESREGDFVRSIVKEFPPPGTTNLRLQFADAMEIVKTNDE